MLQGKFGKGLIVIIILTLIVQIIGISVVNSHLYGPKLCFREYLVTPNGMKYVYDQGAIISFNGNDYPPNSCVDYQIGTYKLVAYVGVGYIFVKWDSNGNIRILNSYNSTTYVQLYSPSQDRSYINLYIRLPWLYFHVYLITSNGLQTTKEAKIIFNGATYQDGNVITYNYGTYNIAASFNNDIKFDHWSSSSTILIVDPSSAQTSATLRIQTVASDQFISLYVKGKDFAVAFIPSGLPSNLYWRVSIGNITKSALGTSSINFTLLKGNYTFTIPPVITNNILYYPSPSSGNLNVNNNLTVYVTFYAYSQNNGNNNSKLISNNIQVKLIITDSNRNINNLTQQSNFIGIVGEKVKFILFIYIPNNIFPSISQFTISLTNIYIQSQPREAFVLVNNNLALVQSAISIQSITYSINSAAFPLKIYLVINKQNNIALSFNKGDYTVNLVANLRFLYNGIPLKISYPINAAAKLTIDEVKISLVNSTYIDNKLFLSFRYYWKTLNLPVYNKSGLLSIIIVPFGLESSWINDQGFTKMIVDNSVIKSSLSNIAGQLEAIGIYYDGAYVANSLSYINYTSAAISFYNSKQETNIFRIIVIDLLNLKGLANSQVFIIVNDVPYGIFKTDNSGKIELNYAGLYSLGAKIFSLYSNNTIVVPSQYSYVTLFITDL